MSAILSADNLNDFITPGVACIKPVETLPVDASSSQNGLENEVIRDGAPVAGAGPAQISLTDCLACSGCVTSAEAVLVSLQSHAEVLRTLDAAPGLQLHPASTSSSSASSYTVDGLDDPARHLYVASVSPQTRANLAAACGPGVTEREAGYMLEQLLSGPQGLAAGGAFGNGFTWVVDTNAAREAALVLGADEVIHGPLPETCQSHLGKPPAPRPLLTSSCPGWVCYAEKTHPHVLSHLSHVKSPQALTGTLLKTTLSRALGLEPSRIWHVAVMPCFDKKLEASREELTDAVWSHKCSGDSSQCGSGSGSAHKVGVRDVDCVITSKEILMLAESRGIDFFSLPKTPPPPPQQWRSSSSPPSTSSSPSLSPSSSSPSFPPSSSPSSPLPSSPSSSYTPPLPPHHHHHLPFPDPVLDRFLFPPRRRRQPAAAAGSSGGNLHFVLQSVLAQHPGATLQTTRGRNVDVVEYAILAPGAAPGDAPLFKAARYYGFRNIQNLVRRLRPARPSRLPGGRPIGSARKLATTRAAKAGSAGAGAGAGLDYSCIEVMACPGGCTNGGGQIKIDDAVVVARRGLAGKPGPLEQKVWLAQIDEAYFSAEESDSDGDVDMDVGMAVDVDADEDAKGRSGPSSDEIDGISPSYVRETLAHWARITGIDLRRLAYTSFREVVSDIGKAKTADTAERVVQLAGKIGGGW